MITHTMTNRQCTAILSPHNNFAISFHVFGSIHIHVWIAGFTGALLYISRILYQCIFSSDRIGSFISPSQEIINLCLITPGWKCIIRVHIFSWPFISSRYIFLVIFQPCSFKQRYSRFQENSRIFRYTRLISIRIGSRH